MDSCVVLLNPLLVNELLELCFPKDDLFASEAHELNGVLSILRSSEQRPMLFRDDFFGFEVVGGDLGVETEGRKYIIVGVL